MISDAERREVAARLRHMTCDITDLKEAWRMQGLYTQCQDQADYYQIHNVVMGYFPVGNMHVCDYEELHTRLADLIEPPTQCPHYHSERHYCSVHEDLQVIDRDALLKIADEILKSASTSDELHKYMLAGKLLDMATTFREYACELREYAERIRAALGVQDDA